jgi:hypothetical protein
LCKMSSHCSATIFFYRDAEKIEEMEFYERRCGGVICSCKGVVMRGLQGNICCYS